MQDERIIIEERLENIADMIDNASGFLNNLDIKIPKVAEKAILDIIESKEIKDIVENIKTKRPPRIVVMGRSGVGKSSLINAMFGTYLAETSPVEVGTKNHQFFQYKKNGRTIFEIIDTRGVKENINVQDESAEENLEMVIDKFEPDAFLFLTNGADRSTLREDAADVKVLFNKLRIKPPLITVITRVDSIEPVRLVEPSEYNTRKINNINVRKKQVKKVLHNEGLPNDFVVPVSAYIEWSHDEPENLSQEAQEQLTIEFDGRYNIEELLNTIENNIEFNAALDMMLQHEAEKAIEKIAHQFVKKFSNVSFLVGVTPIPGMDIVILLPIQIAEVIVITYLSGNQVDAKSAREFIVSLGAVFLFGFGLRFVAQAGTKLLNVVPGAGSAISGAIAYSGTYSIGKAAIAYYINGKSIDEAKEEARKAKEELEGQEIENPDEYEAPNMPNKVDSIQDEFTEIISIEETKSDETNETEETKLNKFKDHLNRNVDKAKDKWDTVKTKFKERKTK